jgi:TatD DNase family protein
MLKPLYKLVDIGANLAHPSFRGDYADVLDRAKQAGKMLKKYHKNIFQNEGIVKLMITGSSEQSTKEAAKLARENPNFLFYTAGNYPKYFYNSQK